MYMKIGRLSLASAGLLATVAFGLAHLKRPTIPASPPDSGPGASSAAVPHPGLPRLPIEAAALAAPDSAALLAGTTESTPPQIERADTEALTRAELERLGEAVQLTGEQRPRAAKVVRAVCHLRTLVSRQLVPSPTAETRKLQIDRQERLALLAVLRPEQQPLLDLYLSRR
jgi:hypothetical protein